MVFIHYWARGGWVFSEVLSVDRMRSLVEKSADSASAEAELIAYLKEGEVIRAALNRLNRYEDMRPRLPLLRKAAEDYFKGRYYSVVLVLIAVMDGFVNDSDKSIRRGLHTRDPASASGKLSADARMAAPPLSGLNLSTMADMVS